MKNGNHVRCEKETTREVVFDVSHSRAISAWDRDLASVPASDGILCRPVMRIIISNSEDMEL